MIWWKTREHFEDEYAECVPIDAFIVALLAYDLSRTDVGMILGLSEEIRTDLGRKVVGSTAERPSCEGAWFCKPEIGYFDVPVKVEQDVFGFKVTIDDIESVEMMEGQSDFCCIKFRNWIGKSLGGEVSKG